MLILLFSCEKRNIKIPEPNDAVTNNFTISFGSCNNQNIPNPLWDPIVLNKPDLFLWGGDIIYSDTYDMKVMKNSYQTMKNDSSYMNFKEKIPVLGTWDDHDYGLNDGGASYSKKDSVQQIFLDFFDTDANDQRRKQRGIYFLKAYQIGDAWINIIMLDTRYFRTELTKDPKGKKRYIPNSNDEGTILGAGQWTWLEEVLTKSKANFNVIVSSIQFLSDQHGFETWGNMPNEVLKMKDILAKSGAKGVIILSGDRHLAEISKVDVEGMAYPLIDFTSSGMTHSYSSYAGEVNPYRVTEVVSQKNFGVLRFDLKKNEVNMEIRGEGNELYESYTQKY
jgi:alkaline phosphatase D